MRITFVSGRYRPPHFRGGIERYTHVIGTKLAEMGEDVSVVAVQESLPCETKLAVKYIPVPGFPYLNTAAFYLRTTGLWHDRDIVAVQYAHFGLSVPGSRLVPTVHTTCLGEARSLRRSSKSLITYLRTCSLATQGAYLERSVYRRAARIITLNETGKDHLVKDYHINPAKIDIVGNGVDTGEFRPKDGKTCSHILRLVYVGRLQPRKNVSLLLHGVKASKRELELTVVGDGPELPNLKTLAHQLQIQDRVTFTGRRSGAALLEVYQNADVFVMPSLYEGVPLTVLEAMACGLPVVSTPFDGVNNLVTSDTGLVVPGAPEVFAKALDSLNSLAVQKMGAAARQQCLDQFSWHSKAKEILKIYQRVHDQPSSPVLPMETISQN